MIDQLLVKCPGCGQDARPHPLAEELLTYPVFRDSKAYRIHFPVEHKRNPVCPPGYVEAVTFCDATWEFDPRMKCWIN